MRAPSCSWGRLRSADGTVHEGRWERGELDESIPSRTDRRLPDGSRYSGGWLRGVPHGRGTLVQQNGERLDGLFAQGELDTSQPYTVARRLADGQYVGEMLGERKHGFGILTQGADVCEGSWAAGMPIDCDGAITIDGQRYQGALRAAHGMRTRSNRSPPAPASRARAHARARPQAPGGAASARATACSSGRRASGTLAHSRTACSTGLACASTPTATATRGCGCAACPRACDLRLHFNYLNRMHPLTSEGASILHMQ